MPYQRAQIIVGLWIAFAGPFSAIPALKDVPKRFVRRVGNLLDRGVGIIPERRSGQKGVFQDYGLDDAAELGIGLSLLNAGLPQAEVIEYLLIFRDIIRKEIESIPHSSVGAPFPYFLIVQPKALNETVRRFAPKLPVSAGGLNFYHPTFVKSQSEWAALPNEIGKETAERIIVEIGDLVSQINHWLPEITERRRGR